MSASPAATREGQLEWEARTAKPAAAAAFLAVALTVANVAIQAGAIGRPDNEREALLLVDKHHGDFFLSLGTQVVSYLLLTGALLYLLRATMHRRPETPQFAIALLLLAPVLLAVGGVLNQLDLNDIADQFLASGSRSNDRAEELLKDQSNLGRGLLQGGSLCLALSFVLVSLNAMRAGLLSRFMGVLGMIVGGLLVLPLLPGGQSMVQIFWLAALGVLFLGRWPNGRGPAWETGEAVPWPSAAETRDDALVGRSDASEPVTDPASDSPADATPRRRSRKRKKKPR
ncbi:MAG TPA: hypothetical protein VGV10_08160 [Thermoleophilaceae bacterium]|nr:hypothetical protein [Thermoleophilaceae bacterium]